MIPKRRAEYVQTHFCLQKCRLQLFLVGMTTGLTRFKYRCTLIRPCVESFTDDHLLSGISIYLTADSILTQSIPYGVAICDEDRMNPCPPLLSLPLLLI
jgi:hypothetical protein